MNVLLRKAFAVTAFVIASVNSHAIDVVLDKDVETAASSFYKWYITAIWPSNHPKSMKMDLIAHKKAIDEQLMVRIATSCSGNDGDECSQGQMELGHDYFTQSQDYDDSWVSSLKPKKVWQQGDSAVVILRLDQKLTNALVINFKKTEGRWRILGVRDTRFMWD
ncbi:MAG: YbjP/YqhG family protein [Betaproteobacteria bacterium]|nr:YbjP/YqhG family protein [Betaproteobacteria bacterium]